MHDPSFPGRPQPTAPDRLLTYFIVVGAVAATFWSLLWMLMGSVRIAGPLLAAAILMTALHPIRRRIGTRAASHLAIAVGSGAVFWPFHQTGGVEGPLGMWILVLPVAAGLLLPPRLAAGWGLGLTGLTATYWLLNRTGFQVPDQSPAEYRQVIESISHVTVLLVILSLSVIYARAQERTLATAAAANRALREQTRELERANRGLRESQEQLLLSERMAAVGRLAGGIAHEINSPLASVMNALQLAGRYLREYGDSLDDPEISPEDHRGIHRDLTHSLALAESAAAKAAEFVRTIKGQIREGSDSVTRFDPAAEIEASLPLLRHMGASGALRIHAELEHGAVLVGDAGRFALVLQNLVSNAVDACEGGTPEVWLRGRSTGDGYLVEVEDRGAGIPPEVQSRIFDYLFTTKPVGKGTGLGLSLVHGIVTNHFRGSIEFRSEPGVGTTFSVRLPHPEEPGRATATGREGERGEILGRSA